MRFARILKHKYEKIINYFKSNEEVFANIYRNRKWYSNEADSDKFNSGNGSDKKYVIPYVTTVSEFIAKNNIKTVVDLGCGDFRASSLLVGNNRDIDYTGVDVVSDLIEYLDRKFREHKKVKFLHKDITKDELPKGELYLIRVVLQHLSNKEISKILRKIPAESFLIVTECQFLDREGIDPNIDKIRGADTRLDYNSGVYLDEKPYNLPVATLSMIKINETECLRVFLVER